ncbi:hypothetical protein [Fodinicola feengrottensis]|uniref:hypothetical protein n=1 Tax=Fodinicola feengrottensis TaxID=435914 RepID=UPI0013D4028B|nr:hypothetical protein [Fodinicola feengrottensis]
MQQDVPPRNRQNEPARRDKRQECGGYESYDEATTVTTGSQIAQEVAGPPDALDGFLVQAVDERGPAQQRDQQDEPRVVTDQIPKDLPDVRRVLKARPIGQLYGVQGFHVPPSPKTAALPRPEVENSQPVLLAQMPQLTVAILGGMPLSRRY